LITGHRDGVPYTVSSPWADLWDESEAGKVRPVKVYTQEEIVEFLKTRQDLVGTYQSVEAHRLELADPYRRAKYHKQSLTMHPSERAHRISRLRNIEDAAPWGSVEGEDLNDIRAAA
jgi:hypothetical protein